MEKNEKEFKISEETLKEKETAEIQIINLEENEEKIISNTTPNKSNKLKGKEEINEKVEIQL